MKDVRLRIYSADGAYTNYREDYLVYLRTHRAIFKDGPSIGNCCIGELEVSLKLPSSAIPRNAKLVPYLRESDTWVKKGEFFVYCRKVDPTFGVVQITAYDAIYKAERPFVRPGDIGQWPRTDLQVMDEIAQRTGTTIHAGSRAAINRGYLIQFPGITIETDDGGTSKQPDGATTMREMAGYVASMYAANWFINNDGEWQLSRLGDVPPVSMTNVLVEEHGDAILIGGVRILV